MTTRISGSFKLFSYNLTMTNLILVLDVDGVVLRSVMPSSRIYTKTFSSHFDLSPAEISYLGKYFIATQGQPLKKQITESIELLNKERDRRWQTSTLGSGPPYMIASDDKTVRGMMNYYYEMKYGKNVPLYADVVPLLMQARGELGWNVCLSTGMRQDNVERVIAEHGLRQYIDFALGKTAEHPSKDKHIHAILEEYGVSEEEFQANCALCGDSLEDIRIANEWGVTYPVYVIRPHGLHAGSAERDVEMELSMQGYQHCIAVRKLTSIPKRISEKRKH